MPSPYLEILRSPRIAAVLLLGFSSGLPLALTGGTLQAWLTVAGVDIMTIAWFSWIGIPYLLKFLWSPLMDRYVPPFLGLGELVFGDAQAFLNALARDDRFLAHLSGSGAQQFFRVGNHDPEVGREFFPGYISAITHDFLPLRLK